MASCFIKMQRCLYRDYETSENIKERRSYYDMTGKDNIYKYMVGEVIRVGNSKNPDWVGNYTGVFNRDGVLSRKQIEEMKSRLVKNKGPIWYGFISTPKELGYKINSPQKCIKLLKFCFIDFLKEAGFHYENIDLMCALHSQVKDHIHMHFVFWERKERYYTKRNDIWYEGYKGKVIPKRALDKLKMRVEYFLNLENQVEKSREETYIKLGKMLTFFKGNIKDMYDIKEEMFLLSKDIPKDCEHMYYSLGLPYEMEERVDKIKAHIFMMNTKARSEDMAFFKELNKTTKLVSSSEDELRALMKVSDIQKDYENTLGDKIFGFCKYMKDWEYKPKDYSYKMPPSLLKAQKARHKCNVKNLYIKFAKNIGREVGEISKISRYRLKDIQNMVSENNRDLSKGGKA